MRLNCDFFRSWVLAQFNALEDYRSHMEAQIQENRHSIRSQILTQYQTPPDTSEEVEEWLSMRQAEVDECDRRFTVVFRRILRFTVLMSVYTLVESNLCLISKEMTKRKNLKLDMMDLKAKNLVKQFEKFWTKVAGLHWWTDDRWDLLKDIQKLRNYISHRNGVIIQSDNRIKQILQRNCGVRLVDVNDRLTDPDEKGTLEIEERFCREGLEKMKSLFDDIFQRAGCFGPDHIVVEPD
jgi:hypothetical protein